MENKYRVKINELNNGEKRYIPQVGFPKIRLWKIIVLSYVWENIIMDYLKTFQTYTTISDSYETEEDAIAVIEGYKKYLTEKEGKKVNKTTYKEL